MGKTLVRQDRSYWTANRRPPLACFALTVLLSPGLLAGPGHVAHEGRTESVIVLSGTAKGLYPLAAAELQKYIGLLTGAQPPIITPEEVASLESAQALLLVGGPEANPLVRKAVERAKLDFPDLQPEGFLLRTLQVEGHPALVIAGDEAGTLYGAYEWLEQQGIVFLLNDDIVPAPRETLPLQPVDLRSESPFRRRGYGLASCFEHRSIWSYPDLVKFIDQMAKLKLNYLIWHWFPQEPYLEYAYIG